ncbi:hypothetical protein Bca4012_038053 [Brassica carinata]
MSPSLPLCSTTEAHVQGVSCSSSCSQIFHGVVISARHLLLRCNRLAASHLRRKSASLHHELRLRAQLLLGVVLSFKSSSWLSSSRGSLSRSSGVIA